MMIPIRIEIYSLGMCKCNLILKMLDDIIQLIHVKLLNI